MPKRSPPKGRYADALAGLFLQATDAGQSWVYRYSLNGRERMMGLGSADKINRDQARAAAVAAAEIVKNGTDPIFDRKERKQQHHTEQLTAAGNTFEAVARDYIEAHKIGWAAIHERQVTNSLRDHVNPIIGKLPVNRIDTALVLKVLTPIWGTKTVTASRVRQRIEAVLDYAFALKLHPGPNPAMARTIGKLLPKRSKIHKVKHYESVPYREMPDLMQALRAREGARARALEFVILTAARTAEVRQMTGAEIDLAAAVWTAPALHIKGRKEHRRPLSDRVTEIVSDLITKNDALVFRRDDGTPLGDDDLIDELRKLRPGKATAHGLRTSFRTWCEETRLEWRLLAEIQLAHEVYQEVEKSYQRSDLLDQRRAMMEAWEQFLSAPASGKVVPIRGRL